MRLYRLTQLTIDLLFPRKTNRKHGNFDFSKISPDQLLHLNSTPLILGRNNKMRVWACLSYKNILVRNLIWNIKNHKDRHSLLLGSLILSKKLDEIIKSKFAIETNANSPILIPIPINQERRHERGYNQCELLAQQIQCNFTLEIRTDILFRIKEKNKSPNNKKQSIKKRPERIIGIKGAFDLRIKKLKKIPGFKNRLIIIIDDVLTTGSTINEAATTLQKAGCENIIGLALAH